MKDYVILIKEDKKIKLKIYNEKIKVRVVVLSKCQLANLLTDAAGIANALIHQNRTSR